MREMGLGWWKMLTQARVDVFAEEKVKTNFPRLVLVVVVVAVLDAIFAPQPVQLDLGVWVRSVGLVLAGFFVIALALFVAARVFGGRASLIQHLYIMGVLAMPTVIIFGLLARIDVKEALLHLISPLGLAVILLFLVFIFLLLLLFLAMAGVHELSGHRSVRVVGIVVLLGLISFMTYVVLAGIQNTLVDYSLYIWSKRADLLVLSVAHAEIVLFSMAIAITLGVIIGILITLPSHPIRLWHLALLFPLAAFAFLWFGSIGTLGVGIKDLFAKDGAIGLVIGRPQAIGVVGLILLLILYALYVVGDKSAEPVLYTAGVLLTIPSIALFGMFIPIFGIGFFNAAVALILYAQLPILRNTYTGIKEVPQAVVDSARGMGMTEWQILYKVKMPLAMPVIMAGIRVSMVMIVGIAAIATLIGVEVLGRYIFDGMQRISDRMVFAGAVAVSIFAIIVDVLLGWWERLLTPIGMRKKAQRSEEI